MIHKQTTVMLTTHTNINTDMDVVDAVVKAVVYSMGDAVDVDL